MNMTTCIVQTGNRCCVAFTAEYKKTIQGGMKVHGMKSPTSWVIIYRLNTFCAVLSDDNCIATGHPSPHGSVPHGLSQNEKGQGYERWQKQKQKEQHFQGRKIEGFLSSAAAALWTMSLTDNTCLCNILTNQLEFLKSSAFLISLLMSKTNPVYSHQRLSQVNPLQFILFLYTPKSTLFCLLILPSFCWCLWYNLW